MTREHCTLLAALHNSSTPGQPLNAVVTLKDYEIDAQALMGDAAERFKCLKDLSIFYTQ